MINSKMFLCVAMCYMFMSCTDALDIHDFESSPQASIDYTRNDDFVPINQARDVADAFMAGKDSVLFTKTANEWDSKSSDVLSINKDGAPLMYVVNYKGGGFVIISATRNYLPVLAYSDEGAFDISSVSGGLGLWLDETMTAVELSGEKSDSLKTAMNRLWNIYNVDPKGKSVTKSNGALMSTAGEIACAERCDQLSSEYYSDGWNFLPLSDAESIFDDAGFSDYYDQLCYSANFNHSELSSSVVGWKIGTFTESYGPLLLTDWHQRSPFNDLCEGKPAGCGAIALGQLMKYYEYPQLITYNGNTFGWDTIPIGALASSNQSSLIRAIGVATNMHYWSTGSWTTPQDMEDGIESFGYTVTRQDDDYHDVENELLNNHRPVIMLGSHSNTSSVPGSLAYIGNSHYWVVDGVRRVESDIFMVFAEWQPYDCGQFTQSYFSIDDPDVISGVSYLYYHCNWGRSDMSDAWYAYNGYDYTYSRQNYLISIP